MAEKFNKEAPFEVALVEALRRKGWGQQPVLMYPTEADLIENWRQILSKINNGIDCLNGCPLTDGEMQQVLQQVRDLRSPLRLNSEFINGKSISIVRDNPDDTLHFGKTVNPIVYDKQKIGSNDTVYQIARQPKFTTNSQILGERRGDFTLLINGMPLIHVELKRSGVPVRNACNQIERYMRTGVFDGIFSLVQIFVAMNPEETLYFANPGPDGKFNSDFFFHWADFNNELINDWPDIAETLLSIPMAHQLIGYYTVPDKGDGILKVMRSYQYYAARSIFQKVQQHNWKVSDQLGGHIWHTTGSGKTLTSFKSAQLIAQSNDDAEKVVFLVDRIELGDQSYKEYSGFAEEDTVQDTSNTNKLIAKLKSSNSKDKLIVTSIQKMSRINDENMQQRKNELEQIRAKKIVFIVDEAHRSVFGEMYPTIRETFPMALFFGFTGTPIMPEYEKNMNTTVSLFGDELHRYVMPDGIRDGNVLGFNPVMCPTYDDIDLRQAVALEKAKAHTEEEALADDAKKAMYLKYMDDVPMAGEMQANGELSKGIEDYLPPTQYDRPEHRERVVDNIIKRFTLLSRNRKYHAILATSRIEEAVEYFKLLRAKAPQLNITSLFDPSVDESGNGFDKEAALELIIGEYNTTFGKKYEVATYAAMKKDMSNRLAHKEAYKYLEPGQQIDILIVVNQMLTGFDSKWVNTLYLDKYYKPEQAHDLIQAISRTNRPQDKREKPFGTIRYYRKVHSMKRNIDDAIRMYSGGRPFGVFVDRLPHNLHRINDIFIEIRELFESADIANFSQLPSIDAERGRFAKLFKALSDHISAARLQGFSWEKSDYVTEDGEVITLVLTQEDFQTLQTRYRELYEDSSGSSSPGNLPYEIDTHLTEIETGAIDYDYMNSRFEKYLKELRKDVLDEERLQKLLDDVHKSFAFLSQEEQRYANQFLIDVQSGNLKYNICKSFHDYIIDYMNKAQEGKIRTLAQNFGLDAELLKEMADARLNENNIDEFGRYTRLKASVSPVLAKAYFQQREGAVLTPPKIRMKLDALLRHFILHGEIE